MWSYNTCIQCVWLDHSTWPKYHPRHCTENSQKPFYSCQILNETLSTELCYQGTIDHEKLPLLQLHPCNYLLIPSPSSFPGFGYQNSVFHSFKIKILVPTKREHVFFFFFFLSPTYIAMMGPMYAAINARYTSIFYGWIRHVNTHDYNIICNNIHFLYPFVYPLMGT